MSREDAEKAFPRVLSVFLRVLRVMLLSPADCTSNGDGYLTPAGCAPSPTSARLRG
jgi:hypothetical protein